jgi:hypothetical protein
MIFPTSCYFLSTVKCFLGRFLTTTAFCQSTRQTLGSKCGCCTMYSTVSNNTVVWHINTLYLCNLWRAVVQWLRHCATNWKVAGSIPDNVTGIFHSHNPSGRTMALGSTQPLWEMSTRNFPGGKGGRCVRLTTYHLHVPIVSTYQGVWRYSCLNVTYKSPYKRYEEETNDF